MIANWERRACAAAGWMQAGFIIGRLLLLFDSGGWGDIARYGDRDDLGAGCAARACECVYGLRCMLQLLSGMDG